MTVITHNARVTGPVPYTTGNGEMASIPPGPCMIEQLEGQLVDVIWGPSGEESTVLQMKEIEAAEVNGHLVMLD